jgi:hypothetical protein
METNKILDADILDLVFDGRNKEYGAYDLRKHYNGRLGRAMAVTGQAPPENKDIEDVKISTATRDGAKDFGVDAAPTSDGGRGSSRSQRRMMVIGFLKRWRSTRPIPAAHRPGPAF